MNYDVLAKKARYFKQDENGVATACKIMEDMRNEAAREAAQKAEQNKAKKDSGSFNQVRKNGFRGNSRSYGTSGNCSVVKICAYAT